MTVISIDLGVAVPEGVTLAEAIVDQAAKQLLASIKEETEPVRARVRAIRDEEIREQVRPLVGDTLGMLVQRTDEYGSPKGQPVTLREVILEKAAESFKVSSRNRKSPLEEFITQEVDRAFRGELQEAMKASRAQVLAAVREQGAQIVQETIERMARS